MAGKKESGKISIEENFDVVEIPRAEYERLTSRPSIESNTEPAFEEGPHLKNKAVREAKAEQLADAGFKADDDDLTDDMRSLLQEG